MNIPVKSADYAEDYLFICGAGLFFTAGYNMVSAVSQGSGAFIQSIGNTRLSMVLALLDGVVLRIG